MKINEERNHITVLMRDLARGEAMQFGGELPPECREFRKEMLAFLKEQLRDEIQWESRIEKRGL